MSIIIFLCRVIKKKFYWLIAVFFSFFLEEKKKEIGCSFEFPLFPYCFKFKLCFLLVLFACEDPSPLYKSSKRRDHLKHENLKILFLPLSLHQLSSKNKIIRSLTLLWILDFAIAYLYFNVQLCCYFIVGNKILWFFKNWVDGTLQGGSQVLQNFEKGWS